MTNLARAGLVSIDPASAVRTVRMHPSVQAAVRAYLPPADFEQAVLAAAEALLQAWPETDGSQDPREQARLQQALRDCTSALGMVDAAAQAPGPRHGAHAQPETGSGTAAPGTAQPRRSMLWQPEAHPLLFRKGLSLDADGLAETAVAYWQTMLLTSARLLGSEHASAVTARDRLGSAYESAGMFGDAIAVFSTALAEREHSQGPEHPDTLTARGQLAHAYSSAERPAEAVALYEQLVAGAGRQLGPAHPVTLAARASLAEAYQAAARGKEALTAYRLLLTDSERLLGAQHPSTLATMDSLAAA
jgi:tetratricopeptide (TPR) repeat protein